MGPLGRFAQLNCTAEEYTTLNEVLNVDLGYTLTEFCVGGIQMSVNLKFIIMICLAFNASTVTYVI